MIARLVHAGVSTVQDGGRPGYADVGVPVSGAWHRTRYLLAVGLLTGIADDTTPAIEVLGGDVELRMCADTIIAVVGPARVRVDGQPAAVGACLAVERDQAVTVGHLGPGPVYVVVGGWLPARVLGSASADTFSRVGPPALAAGTVLDGDVGRVDRERLGAFHRPVPDGSGPIRVILTGHPAGSTFVGRRWTVTDTARSGIRLSGTSIPGAGDVPSQPMVRGAIQLTPSGDPVVLGPDGGLTGGYPVVAVIATADLDRMSLLAPGDPVVFRASDPQVTAKAYRDQGRALASAIAHPGLLP